MPKVTFFNRTASETTVPHPVHLILTRYRQVTVGLSEDQLVLVKASADISRLIAKQIISYRVEDEAAANITALAAPEAAPAAPHAPVVAPTMVEAAPPAPAPEAPAPVVEAPAPAPEPAPEAPAPEAAPAEPEAAAPAGSEPETALSRSQRKALRKASKSEAESAPEAPVEAAPAADEPKAE